MENIGINEIRKNVGVFREKRKGNGEDIDCIFPLNKNGNQ
ncbi:hypothetical protein LCGC14_2920240 [marine sediment metagenome]|uniref:Uncharacterized protein n=1 Tax=marine sediment metagenome TaxID=412755 RepID=A0A0F8YAU7_9ZZZZ